MSQASCTIASITFIALLMNGCAIAPLLSDEDRISEDSTAHVESSSKVESPSQPTDDKTPDLLSARLEKLQAEDPDKYAAIQSLLDSTDREVPADLRGVVREQIEAFVLNEGLRQQESTSPDHVQLANWPPRNPPVQKPRLMPTDPQPAQLPSSAELSTAMTPAKADGSEIAVVGPTVSPPRISEVSESTEDSSSSAETLAGTQDLTAGQWQEHLETSIDALEQELVRLDLDEEQAARWNTCLRLLYVVNNQRDQAIEPIESLDEDEREYWKHFLFGLLVSLDADGKHASSRRAALALRDLRAAADHLSNISTLDVKGLAFCPEVYSFGRIVEYDSRTFSPNQEVLLYVEVDNFAVEQKGDQYETELMAEYSLFDSRGVRVANVVLPNDKQLCNNRRRDYFIAYPINISGDLPSGSYTLQLTIEDVIGKKSNHATIDFRIR